MVSHQALGSGGLVIGLLVARRPAAWCNRAATRSCFGWETGTYRRLVGSGKGSRRASCSGLIPHKTKKPHPGESKNR